MSHGKIHHHRGDGASHGHHGSAHHSAEIHISHSHHSAASEALHHEASRTLSSKPAIHSSSIHTAEVSGKKQEPAKTDEPLRAADKAGQETSHSRGDSKQAKAANADVKIAHSIDLNSVPKLSLTDKKPVKSPVELSALVPSHLNATQPADGTAKVAIEHSKRNTAAVAESEAKPAQVSAPQTIQRASVSTDSTPVIQRAIAPSDSAINTGLPVLSPFQPRNDSGASIASLAGRANAGDNLSSTKAKMSDLSITALSAAAAGDKSLKTLSAANIDSSTPMTLADMINTGKIIDKTNSAAQESDRAKLAPGEVPSIKFDMADSAQSGKPDFLVKKDGSIEMYNNPQTTGQKEIVVHFERDGKNFELTDAQKGAGGSLYSNLQKELQNRFPQAAPEAFKVDDSQGLLRDTTLPPEVRRNLNHQQKAEPSPESGLPERSGPTIQDTRRISHGGRHSSVPRGDINNMTPPANPIPHEADRMKAMKDTVASYVTRGDQHPYDYAAKRGERGWGVGRYGMTYKQIGNWLEGLTDQQIEELIKQGKLSADQAANLKKMRDSMQKAAASGDDNDLHPFLKALKNGEGTEEDIRKGVHDFLPDKVQELAASDQIAKIAGELSRDATQRGEKGSADPGQVALSFVLGRTVSKEEYEANPEYKQFVESARQAYRLQEQSRIQNGSVINVENMSQVSQALNNMVGQQFWREAAGATEYGNKGCAIAVTRALQGIGVHIGTHLDVTGTAQDMRSRGWREVSLAEAVRSGQLYVPVNKETGSHIGMGIGRQVWENSSSQRQFVSRDIGSSSLRHSGRAFIVPIQAASKSIPANSNIG